MDSEKERPLLPTVAQVERFISYRRSKIYALMREKELPSLHRRFAAGGSAPTSCAGWPGWARGTRHERGRAISGVTVRHVSAKSTPARRKKRVARGGELATPTQRPRSTSRGGCLMSNCPGEAVICRTRARFRRVQQGGVNRSGPRRVRTDAPGPWPGRSVLDCRGVLRVLEPPHLAIVEILLALPKEGECVLVGDPGLRESRRDDHSLGSTLHPGTVERGARDSRDRCRLSPFPRPMDGATSPSVRVKRRRNRRCHGDTRNGSPAPALRVTVKAAIESVRRAPSLVGVLESSKRSELDHTDERAQVAIRRNVRTRLHEVHAVRSFDMPVRPFDRHPNHVPAWERLMPRRAFPLCFHSSPLSFAASEVRKLTSADTGRRTSATSRTMTVHHCKRQRPISRYAAPWSVTRIGFVICAFR